MKQTHQVETLDNSKAVVNEERQAHGGEEHAGEEEQEKEDFNQRQQLPFYTQDDWDASS